MDKLARRLGARRLTVAGFGHGGDWGGRLVLVDSESEGPREESLRFAQRVVRELGGVVQSRFVLGRMRARIGAMERARIARELHDGTIQSLVAVEMEVNVVRRRADQAGLALAADLARVQGLLRSEMLELRDTMERLKPIEITPEQLVGFLDTTVARFGRDSGIRAIFDCAVEDVDLAARVCREIGRIVQEALQNVRKHSHAQEVLVRFGRAPSGWRLVVDDDGQGFPFDGTLSHVGARRGPQGPVRHQGAGARPRWGADDRHVSRGRGAARHPVAPGGPMTADPDRIRVVIADDHPILREGLRRLLEDDGAFEVVGQAADGQRGRPPRSRGAPRRAAARPRHAAASRGWTRCGSCPRQGAGPRVLLLTVAIDDAQVVEALRAGRAGRRAQGGGDRAPVQGDPHAWSPASTGWGATP